MCPITGVGSCSAFESLFRWDNAVILTRLSPRPPVVDTTSAFFSLKVWVFLNPLTMMYMPNIVNRRWGLGPRILADVIGDVVNNFLRVPSPISQLYTTRVNNEDIGTLAILCNVDGVRRDDVVKVIDGPEVILEGLLSSPPFVLGKFRWQALPAAFLCRVLYIG